MGRNVHPSRGLLYVGIDPGRHGGVGFLFPRRQESYYTPITVTTTKSPRAKTARGNPRVKTKYEYDIAGMNALLQQAIAYRDDGWRLIVVLEAQHQRPNDSKQVVFTVGFGFGVWTALLAMANLQPVTVTPPQWKPYYLPPGATKRDSLELARKLFPRHKLALARDECRAEALLIADYVRRRDSGSPFVRIPERRKRGQKQAPQACGSGHVHVQHRKSRLLRLVQ